jgi:hypothetical protein
MTSAMHIRSWRVCRVGTAPVIATRRQRHRARKRASGATGAEGDVESMDPSTSANGRQVASESSTTNLSADDGDAVVDVYVRDLVTNMTTRVSRASGADGAKGNSRSEHASVSADERFVAFDWTADQPEP